MIRLLFLQTFLLPIFALSQSNISGVVNVYRKVIAVDSAKGYVRLSDASNITQYIGNSVMVIQMKGATIDQSNSSSFGNILQINQAGNFEIGQMCGQKGDTVILENKLQNFYDPTGLVQLIIIPKYVDAIVTGILKPDLWNPIIGTGGVLAIEASGTITLNANIIADSAGFRGGVLINNTSNCTSFLPSDAYYYPSSSDGFGRNGAKKGEGIAEYIPAKEYGKGKQANGGGGGNSPNNGGGGGSNFGNGGIGGNKSSGCNTINPGIGGVALSTYGYLSSNYKIFLGGGGGAGHDDSKFGTPGGRGGGIVYLKCNSLITTGNRLSANGAIPYNAANSDPTSAESDGGGGGGGGGVVILRANTITGNLIVEAKGGRGSDTENQPTSQCAGPGGGGGGGFIWLSLPSFPANVVPVVTGGGNGVIRTGCVGFSNGASPGTAGNFSSGFALPVLKDTSPLCKAVLPISIINSFKENTDQIKRFFTGIINDLGQVNYCILQRSDNGINFINIQTFINNGTVTYVFKDEQQSVAKYYRMLVITKDGSKKYSDIIFIKGISERIINVNIYPNPVSNILNVNINSAEAQSAKIKVTDMAGRIYFTALIQLHPGQQTYKINLSNFAAGTYSIQLLSEKTVLNKMISKL